ncbi:ImmA/IrrE family metallo-endopeptidase [Yersinia aldovae]|uniref:ImmA/IrrE family metallo-endopeptidase n=1 Tax=Yersinia aldovae TaxID=29483 RepID=UPI0011A50218|nr:ImmA/IrrE family metallo-endopeptidase [Yersinia aldovae]
MTHSKPMKRIYDKINTAGFNPGFIKKILPEWWDDSIADTPSGLQYASLHLAKLFSLSAESLWDDKKEVKFSFSTTHKFKHRINIEHQDLDVACAVAYSAANLVAKNFKSNYDANKLLKWSDIRNNILQNKDWVDLESLAVFCSESGIPVIYLKNFPTKTKKMAGLALECMGRPVIVLTQGKKHGFMLFDLAHELGHIACNHLSEMNGQCFVDSKIDAHSTNDVEKQANAFAFGVITGREAFNVGPAGSFLNGHNLACAAKVFGKAERIDPTHVALNYGYSLKHWGVASTAVKEICEDKPSDQEIIIKVLYNYIDMENINDDDLLALKAFIGE